MEEKRCRVCGDVTIKSRRDLHAPSSSDVYQALFDVLLEYYANSKSAEEIHAYMVSSIAATQPHAAYAAFTHGRKAAVRKGSSSDEAGVVQGRGQDPSQK